MNISKKTEKTYLTALFKEADLKLLILFLSIPIITTTSYYLNLNNYYNFFHDTTYSYEEKLLFNSILTYGVDIFLYFIIPALIIRIVFKKKLSLFGFQVGDKKCGLIFSLLAIVAMAIPILIFANQRDFQNYYPQIEIVYKDLLYFFIYFFALLLYVFSWEFLWRGYFLFGLEKKFGVYAIFIQLIPFVLMHNGKPFAETVGAIIGGIVLAVVAIRTRSVFYGVIIHFIIIYLMDIFALFNK